MAATYNAWTTARPANNFAVLLPLLEKTLEYSRRYADYFPGYAEPIDPHIERTDLGMNAASVG